MCATVPLSVIFTISLASEVRSHPVKIDHHNFFELLLVWGREPPAAGSPQATHRPSEWQGCEGPLDQVDMLKFTLNFPAVSATQQVSPGYNVPVSPESCKGQVRGEQLQHIFQLICPGTAVTTTTGIAPGHHLRKDLSFSAKA